MEQLTVKVAGATIRPQGLSNLNRPLIVMKCGGTDPLFNRIYEKSKIDPIQVGVRGQSGAGNVVQDSTGKDVGLKNYLMDITEVMQAMNLEQTSLFGYSHGGYFTLAYAIANPRRVSALIMIEPAWNTPKSELTARIAAINKDKESDGSAGIAKMLQYVSDRGQLKDTPTKTKEITKDWQGGQAIAAEFKVRADNPIKESQLAALKVPTLLIYGTESAVKNTSLDAAKFLPNVSLWGVKGADHLSLMDGEHADEISDVIQIFLKRNS